MPSSKTRRRRPSTSAAAQVTTGVLSITKLRVEIPAGISTRSFVIESTPVVTWAAADVDGRRLRVLDDGIWWYHGGGGMPLPRVIEWGYSGDNGGMRKVGLRR